VDGANKLQLSAIKYVEAAADRVGRVSWKNSASSLIATLSLSIVRGSTAPVIADGEF